MTRIAAQERSNPAIADEVIQAVFARAPDGARQSYIDFLVGAIRHLGSRYNDRWGVTLFDWGVRLNVGWVQSLVLHSGGLRVLVDKDIAPGAYEI
jgi:hypothetical protein